MKKQDIKIDKDIYTWDESQQSYHGLEGSCGSYGATLSEDKWYPCWTPPDCYGSQMSFAESFTDPASAINRSHTYFS